MTFCTLLAPVPGIRYSYRMCGYELGHPPPCKPEKICKSCGGAMNPDKVLDECNACNPELHQLFQEFLQQGVQGGTSFAAGR